MVHMKQNKINKEIFVLLKKEDLHQRELARKLQTSQTNIRRALISLGEDNIVDYRGVGRSLSYFIKDSLESKVFEKYVEIYNLKKALKKPVLRKIYGEILEKINLGVLPQNSIIVLFGSYAKNLETKQSDVDIYIDSDNKSHKLEIQKISNKINVSQGEFDKGSFLLREIKKDHIILNNLEGALKIINEN